MCPSCLPQLTLLPIIYVPYASFLPTSTHFTPYHIYSLCPSCLPQLTLLPIIYIHYVSLLSTLIHFAPYHIHSLCVPPVYFLFSPYQTYAFIFPRQLVYKIFSQKSLPCLSCKSRFITILRMHCSERKKNYTRITYLISFSK